MTNLDLTTAFGDDLKYMDHAAKVALSQLPADAMPALLAALEELTGDEGLTPGIDCSVAVTHETLADFDESRSAHWLEKGSREVIDASGCEAIIFSNFQPEKGGERRSQAVIDFGDIRACLIS